MYLLLLLSVLILPILGWVLFRANMSMSMGDRNSVPTVVSLDLHIAKERGLAGRINKLLLEVFTNTTEIQTGNRAFDDKFLVLCDEIKVSRFLKSSTSFIKITMDLFDRLDKEINELNITNGKVEVRLSPRISTGFFSSKKEKARARNERLAHLAFMAQPMLLLLAKELNASKLKDVEPSPAKRNFLGILGIHTGMVCALLGYATYTSMIQKSVNFTLSFSINNALALAFFIWMITIVGVWVALKGSTFMGTVATSVFLVFPFTALCIAISGIHMSAAVLGAVETVDVEAKASVSLIKRSGKNKARYVVDVERVPDEVQYMWPASKRRFELDLYVGEHIASQMPNAFGPLEFRIEKNMLGQSVLRMITACKKPSGLLAPGVFTTTDDALSFARPMPITPGEPVGLQACVI